MTTPKQVKRPLNLGHRGALSLAPENTLAAFARARAVGADGVEFDVQLSADRELVIIHDYTLERTSDGQGAVAAQTLAELKRLDAGGKFDPRFAGERIPTLQEVIDLLGADMFLNIELKAGQDVSGELPRRAVECVRRNRCADRVIISSFDLDALRAVRAIAPELALGVLYSSPPGADAVEALHPAALHPEWKLAGKELVQTAHAAGQKVNVWTVNSETDMRSLIALGVDAIITNFPQLLAAILKD